MVNCYKDSFASRVVGAEEGSNRGSSGMGGYAENQALFVLGIVQTSSTVLLLQLSPLSKKSIMSGVTLQHQRDKLKSQDTRKQVK